MGRQRGDVHGRGRTTFGASRPTSSETELPIMRYPAAPATNDTAVAMICTISNGIVSRTPHRHRMSGRSVGRCRVKEETHKCLVYDLSSCQLRDAPLLRARPALSHLVKVLGMLHIPSQARHHRMTSKPGQHKPHAAQPVGPLPFGGPRRFRWITQGARRRRFRQAVDQDDEEKEEGGEGGEQGRDGEQPERHHRGGEDAAVVSAVIRVGPQPTSRSEVEAFVV